MARRGTRAEQYLAVAAFYGMELAESLHNPNIPEFVLVQGARRAAHYALTALSLEEKRARKAHAQLLRSGSWAVAAAGSPATALQG